MLLHIALPLTTRVLLLIRQRRTVLEAAKVATVIALHILGEKIMPSISIRLVAFFILCLFGNAAFAEEPLAFGVLNQRSAMLTAQYWNPILVYVSAHSGVPLRLKMGRTAPETTAMTVRGEFAFAYTNHLFTPKRDRLGWRVIARPADKGIQGAIVVTEAAPVKTLAELAGKEVGFPSPEAFVGYWVPMDALLKAGVEVKPVFAGNQEGVMGQLKAGRIVAAAVNAQVMENYARREHFQYRTIWHSETYLDLAVMANPEVPQNKVEAVKKAFVKMAGDEEGRKILRAGAELLKREGELGFVAADDKDYENYRRFYRNTVIPVGDE
jgi:phosphonate transport system substrate-binding protein